MGATLRTGYYIPDVYVIPIELLRPQRKQHRLDVYEAPLPLVVEVWSPSTGDYGANPTGATSKRITAEA